VKRPDHGGLPVGVVEDLDFYDTVVLGRMREGAKLSGAGLDGELTAVGSNVQGRVQAGCGRSVVLDLLIDRRSVASQPNVVNGIADAAGKNSNA
jgi:hypothetical protein